MHTFLFSRLKADRLIFEIYSNDYDDDDGSFVVIKITFSLG